MELSFIVRDQEVGGSNPLAPTKFLESATYNFGNSRKSAMSAWYKAKRSCLIPAGGERSLSFELIPLRQEFCFTGNPILGKFRYKISASARKTKVKFTFSVPQDAIVLLR